MSVSNRDSSSGKEAILYIYDDERRNGRGIEFGHVCLVDDSIGHDSIVTVQNGVKLIDPLILLR